ncbi:MAG TPA: hypothetical protein VFX16_06940 [Pseudonocardiaceae bacterium]|nr:hypothetical protein [Pseudonocardiaceae bacterium]
MAHAARVAGVLPLLGAVVAAGALAGAAVFTVSQAACPNPGHYVQQGVALHLVGGCVSREELVPGIGGAGEQQAQAPGVAAHGTGALPQNQNRP